MINESPPCIVGSNYGSSRSLDPKKYRESNIIEVDAAQNSAVAIEGPSNVLESEVPVTVSGADQNQWSNILNTRTAGRIRVTKDHWRKENRLALLNVSPQLLPINQSQEHLTSSASLNTEPLVSSEIEIFDPKAGIVEALLYTGVLNIEPETSGIDDQRLDPIAVAAAATEAALRMVRMAELDRQRILHFLKSPPRDEYTIIDEDIPPYRAQLHRYLDLISYDERFAPVLRVNRYLVQDDTSLEAAIKKFSKFNLLPKGTNLWAISHVDDNYYEHMIPELIPQESYYQNEVNV